MNTVFGQPGSKNFIVSIAGKFSVADLQAEINTWLSERNKEKPAPQAEVKQVLDNGNISQDQALQALELLEAYSDTAATFAASYLSHLRR